MSNNNNGFFALLSPLMKKLPRKDALLIIYLIVLALLFGYIIRVLSDASDKIPNPFDKIFLVMSLAIPLTMVVACFKVISKLISKHEYLDED
jgi:hypothetical protein